MKNQRAKKRNLLFVSDDHSVRESLGAVLRTKGFDVRLVENGRQAVRTLAANAPSAIVLDHQTPFDPKEAGCRRSSTLAAITDIDPFLPLVLVCESGTQLDHATLLMADMVLRHPVDASVLLEAIETLLAETLKERVYRKSGHVAVLR